MRTISRDGSNVKTEDTGVVHCLYENCGREFSSPLRLLVHQYESNHLSVLCFVCDKSFSRRENLRRHIKSLHLQEEHVCDQCIERRCYNRSDNLFAHQMKVHGMVRCKYCAAGFTDIKCLKEHMTMHH